MSDNNYEKIENFEKNGILVKRQLFSKDEISIFQEESLKLWQSQKNLNTYNLRVGLRKDKNGETILERLDPVIDISNIFKQLNENGRLIDIIEKLLKEKAAVMKEKLIYKWTGTSGYGAHRDITYFESSGCKNGKQIITAAIALDDINEENGATRFYPKQRLKNIKSNPAEERDLDEKELIKSEEFMPCAKAGDVIFFDGIIPHLSKVNLSENSRRVYMITYLPKRYKDARKNYYENRYKEQEADRIKNQKGEYFLA